MDKKTRRQLILSLAADSFIAACTVKSVLGFFSTGGDGNMRVWNTRAFRYYTVDSNVLVALASLFMIAFSLRSLKKGERKIPRFVMTLKFAGTATVTVTLLVVVCFLGPLMGYKAMFAGNNLYMHLTTPLLALLSLILFETRPDTVLTKGEALCSVCPTAIYGAVYFTQVMLRDEKKGGWPDFYRFNMGGKWYLAVIAIAALALFLAWALRKLQRLRAKKD